MQEELPPTREHIPSSSNKEELQAKGGDLLASIPGSYEERMSSLTKKLEEEKDKYLWLELDGR